MKNLVLLFLLLGCTKQNGPAIGVPVESNPTSVVSTPVSNSSPTPTPQPNTQKERRISLEVKITGANDKQLSRLKKIAANTEVVINDKQFGERILGAMYNGKNGFYGTSISRKEVLQRHLEGDELRKGKLDYRWTIDLRLAKAEKSTLGWTYSGSIPIYFNTANLDTRADSGIAGTFCHEQSHKLGFTHSQEWTSFRKYSVPYSIGTICAEIYKEKF